jgi:hypothetical protein
MADLSELLARASSLVGELKKLSDPPDVSERPSFLGPDPENDPQAIIEKLAAAERVTFVVGAGASMEAGLPSWGSLVHGLLEDAAPKSFDQLDRAAWLDAVAETGLLGMAAAARALAESSEEFVERIKRHLYGGKQPDQFEPGPLAHEIARWKQAYPEIQLATFNYDQLLERALDDVGLAAESRRDNTAEPVGTAYVRHLHGLLTDVPTKGAVVLTEGDYARWRQGAWQDEFMTRALEGLCVFVGLSFTDPNLLRWVYGTATAGHIAVLTRQTSPRLSPKVRRELETATRARLQRAHVTAYWADFYAGVAQLMHEARRRRGPGRPPAPYPARAQNRAERGRTRCIPERGLETRQSQVRHVLAGLVAGVRAALRSVEIDPSDAVLGIGLWGVDYGTRTVALWALSDRVHTDFSTIVGVPLAWGSEWVAIEAITQGAVVERDPQNYASRWRSVRGIPLVWTGLEDHERIVVGAATLTSTEPAGRSILDRAEEQAPGIKRTIDQELQMQLVRLWN